MTINEAITQVLTASHIDDQKFRWFLRFDDPEVVAMRAALVKLADAVRTPECPECGATGRETFTSDLDICLGCGDLLPGI